LFFGDTRVWTQGFVLSRHLLNGLSYTFSQSHCFL
jgi:hypothetical protein